jgi:hypothetical protein
MAQRPKVVKLKRTKGEIVQDCDVYIGRDQNQGGWRLKKSIWHNRFTVKVHGDRCIELYKEEFYQKVRDDPDTWIPLLVDLEGKTLGCWCAPAPCHGNVIADLVVKVVNAANNEEGSDAIIAELWG